MTTITKRPPYRFEITFELRDTNNGVTDEFDFDEFPRTEEEMLAVVKHDYPDAVTIHNQHYLRKFAPTKAEEIAILSAAACELGPRSYCGQWLSEQIAFIREQIASDLPPVPSMKEAQQKHDGIVRAAEDTAQRVKEQSLREVARIREEGAIEKRRIQSLRTDAARQLERIAGEIDH